MVMQHKTQRPVQFEITPASPARLVTGPSAPVTTTHASRLTEPTGTKSTNGSRARRWLLRCEYATVPYRDPWMPVLIAGRVHFVLAPAPAVVAQVRGGRLRALATLTADRLPAFDGVPSIHELGWPEQVFHGGLFLFAPAALAPLAPRLKAWLVEVLSQADIGQRYREASIEPTPLNLAQTADLVRQRLQLIDSLRLRVFGRTR